MPPALVLRRRKGDMQEWPPFRPLWPADKRHVRFLRQPVALSRVTANAGANHILPSSRSATITRHHVIEVQLVAIESLTAVLARILITLENVVPRKLYLLFW